MSSKLITIFIIISIYVFYNNLFNKKIYDKAVK